LPFRSTLYNTISIEIVSHISRSKLKIQTETMAAMSHDALTASNASTINVYRDVYPAIGQAQPTVSKAGKIVMITGASRGIGRDGIAWAFATAGA
jgi:hypothetical protein